MPETRFFVDAMLGSLAKKLRLLGFDTSYSRYIKDEDLISTAKSESRIIVSRDAQLIQIASKQKVPAILITREGDLEQILQINDSISLGRLKVSPFTARCTVCNDSLLPADRQSVKGLVHDRIFESVSRFWRCQKCCRVYWQGSHIDNLQKFVSELNEKM